MPEFQTTRRVMHSADEMFDLVADIEAYPHFVPLCEALRIRGRETSEAREVVIADMTVAYKFLSERFTSRITLDRGAQRILVEYLDGPFRKMENRWRFHDLGGQASEVEFYICYEFRSRSLQILMGAMFDKAFRKFSSAFEQRADQVYGRSDRRQARGVTAS